MSLLLDDDELEKKCEQYQHTDPMGVSMFFLKKVFFCSASKTGGEEAAGGEQQSEGTEEEEGEVC